jgi:hypothetical protein
MMLFSVFILLIGFAIAEEKSKYSIALEKEKMLTEMAEFAQQSLRATKASASPEVLWNGDSIMSDILQKQITTIYRRHLKVSLSIQLAKQALESAENEEKDKIQAYITEHSASLPSEKIQLQYANERVLKLSEKDRLLLGRIISLEFGKISIQDLLSDLVSDRQHKTPLLRRGSFYIVLIAVLCFLVGLGLLRQSKKAALALIGGSITILTSGVIWRIVTRGKELEYTIYIPKNLDLARVFSKSIS